MNDRLRHTPEGYLRAMQMTSTPVIIFVEGENYDAYFYSEICQKLTTQYEVRLAREIPREDGKFAGGKVSLILWFNYLKQHSALLINSAEKKQVSVFFLDKDVDDILKKITKSPHIVYTEYYCIENHIFVEGDLNKAAAIIASCDSKREIIGDCAKWRQEVAKQWNKWVKLCLFSRSKGLKCECDYKSLPNKNRLLYGIIEDNIYHEYEETVKTSSKLTEKRFRKAFGNLSKKVDKLYDIGKHDLVFKGKWYAGFFEVTIEKVIGTKLGNKTGHKSYFQIIMSTLNFNSQWAEYFKKPLRLLINKIK